jgi:hypothetical protein
MIDKIPLLWYFVFMAIEHGTISDVQVTLPDQYEQRTLRGLLPGEAAFSTPWTIWFDLGGAGWVSVDAEPQDEKGGTVEMWLGRFENGFVADIFGLEPQWNRSKGPSGFGHTAENSAPLIGLITNPRERQIAIDALKNLPGFSRHTPLP